MARVFFEELDARDEIAQGIFVKMIGERLSVDYRSLARTSYDAAEAFLAVREGILEDEDDEPDTILRPTFDDDDDDEASF